MVWHFCIGEFRGGGSSGLGALQRQAAAQVLLNLPEI